MSSVRGIGSLGTANGVNYGLAGGSQPSAPTQPVPVPAQAQPASAPSPLISFVQRAQPAHALMAKAAIPRHLGHPLFTPGTVSLLAGEGGAGKGLMIKLLTSILAHGTSLGPVAPGGPVPSFLLLREDSEGITGARLAAIQVRHRLTLTGLSACAAECAEGLWFARTKPNGEMEINPDLAKNLEELRDAGFKVAVFDSAQLLAGGIIMDNFMVAALLDFLGAEARRLDMALCIVTHFSKGQDRSSSDRIKGASAWRDGVRIAAILERLTAPELNALGLNAQDPDVKARHVALEVVKANNAPTGRRYAFRIETVTYSNLSGDKAPVLVPVGPLTQLRAAVAADHAALRSAVLAEITMRAQAGHPIAGDPKRVDSIKSLSAVMAAQFPDLASNIEKSLKGCVKELLSSGAIVEVPMPEPRSDGKGPYPVKRLQPVGAAP